jgi:hypothetical protein
MHLRVRVPRMRQCLNHPRRRIIHLFHSSNSQRGSASASRRVRAKGAMRRVQRKWQGLRVQFPTLWHQVQGLMRNTHYLQTPRSVLRRKGRAIVAVVAKSGKSYFLFDSDMLRFYSIFPWVIFVALVSFGDLGPAYLLTHLSIKQMRRSGGF